MLRLNRQVLIRARRHSTGPVTSRLFATRPGGKPSVQQVNDEDDSSNPNENPNSVLQPPFQSPGGTGSFHLTRSPSVDAAITTAIGIAMVFIGGIAYFAWYKKNVLDKIEQAFAPGYDPALELATHVKQSDKTKAEHSDDDWPQHMRRAEQDQVDRIISGQESGKYFVLIGPKGSGKGTMILDAMHKIDAAGVAFCEVHPDLEVFRLRIGRALNFEYNEDTQTGLFQRRDPREGGAALDIERAMTKLEKVALRLSRKLGRPLVLVFNNVHLFQNNEEGNHVLLQLQQRAETWAESGILTMVFAMDDFWPFLSLKRCANRMQILSVRDLAPNAAVLALRKIRLRAFPESKDDTATFREVVKLMGGRLSNLAKAARSTDMMDASKKLLENEKAWILDLIGLIPDLDDDVMDEQKWSSCSWLLLQEFVKMRLDDEAKLESEIQSGLRAKDPNYQLPLPVIPYWRCRQIMTRPDFLEGLDQKNIISIDVDSNVRPDSELTLNAVKEVVLDPGFAQMLQNVRDRVDEIEGLHRTRELTLKDFQAFSMKDLTDEEQQKVKRLKRSWLSRGSGWW